MSDTAMSLPRIVAFGNVLLDFCAKIDDTEIPDRYNLTLDTQGEISSEVLVKITIEVEKKYGISFNAGGSALNTCRILKSIGGPKALFLGAIGKDRNGEILKGIFQRNNIETCLEEIENCSTGQCICFIYGEKTGLYANIGASIRFSKDFLQSCEMKFYNDSLQQIVYIEGFFVTQREDVCKFVVEKYIKEQREKMEPIDKLLAINLSSPYIIKENFDIMKYLIDHSTLIFGNRNEFQTLVNEMKLNSIDDIAKMLLIKNQKIIVVTNGSQDVTAYTNYKQFNVTENRIVFKVPKVPTDAIVDTTGAGDSFVAGFLSSFLRKTSLNTCIAEGCRIANLVIQQVGCKIE